MSVRAEPTTSIATSTADDIIVRGKSLCHELMGSLSFTEEHGLTPLHEAAANGQKDAAEVLLAYKASVTAKSRRGETPLDLAAAVDAEIEAISASDGGIPAGKNAIAGSRAAKTPNRSRGSKKRSVDAAATADAIRVTIATRFAGRARARLHLIQ